MTIVFQNHIILDIFIVQRKTILTISVLTGINRIWKSESGFPSYMGNIRDNTINKRALMAMEWFTLALGILWYSIKEQ